MQVKKNKGWREKCVRHFMYGGLTKEEYRNCEYAVREKNCATLLLAAPLGVLLSAVLLTAGFFVDSMADARLIYAVLLAVCAGIAVLAFKAAGDRRQAVLRLWYLLYLAAGCCAVGLNTVILPEVSAAAVCVLIMAGPLFILDYPYRIIGIMTILSAVCILCTVCTKAAVPAFWDSVHVLCSLVVSSAACLGITRINLRDIMRTLVLKEERDTDRLTMLLNKSAGEERIRDCLAVTSQGVLLVMDIDDYKHINDTYGHDYGDVVLKRFAQSVRSVFRSCDLCIRFGGDEFVVFLPEISEPVLAALLDVLRMKLREELMLPNSEEVFSVSIGAAFFPQHGKDYPQLFRCADVALYEAKRIGKNCSIIYSE